MARPSYGVRLPDGWTADGALRFTHEAGAVVTRDKNPSTDLIEWCAFVPGERLEWHGQDLHSALSIAQEV